MPETLPAVRQEQAVSVQHSQVTEVQRLGGLLAASGYFSDAREMAQAAVKVLAGQELGIPPVAAMMGMYIVKGKIVLSGNLIASRIRAHGYDYRHKQFDNKGCILEFLGKPDANGKRTILGESSFNEEDAKKAKCFSDMYEKYPRNMYFNRCISNGGKWYTPEVFAGAPVYVAEELGQPIDEQGDMIHEEAPEPRGSAEAARAVADRKIAEFKAKQPAPVIEADFTDLIPEAEAKPEAEALHDDIQRFQPKTPKKPSKSPMERHYDMLRTFAEHKNNYKKLKFAETYYNVLRRHKVEHSNEFPATEEGLQAGLTCHRAMLLNLQELEVSEKLAKSLAEEVPQ